MKNVTTFDDFYINNLLEQASTGKLVFTISDRLKKVLGDISHTISYALLGLDGEQNDMKKVTLLDFDDDDFTKFRISQSNKVIEKWSVVNPETPSRESYINHYLANRLKDTNPIWKATSSVIGIGKVINTIFGKGKFNINQPKGEEKPEIPNDISSFTDQIKYHRDQTKAVFKIVEGKDIIKYYKGSNYQKNINGSNLKNSCMSHDECSAYMEFYANNPVKMLILMSPDEPDKIKGRAILWHINEIGSNGVDRTFMDRIYTAYDYDVLKFINYAKDNNFLYKATQDMEYDTSICDPITDTCGGISMTSYDIKEAKAYPYMDTMKFFNVADGGLRNNDYVIFDYNLETTSGGYMDIDGTGHVYIASKDMIISEDDMAYSELMGGFIDPDDSVYSEYAEGHVTTEYAKEYWEYSKSEEDWIPKTDIVTIQGTDIRISVVGAGEDDRYEYSDVFKTWHLVDDLVKTTSNYGFLPKDKAVKVYMNYPKTEIDWIPNTERYANEYFEKDGEYYFMTMDKDQI